MAKVQSGRKRPSLARGLILAVVAVFLAGSLALVLGAKTYGDHAADQAYDQLLLGAALQIAQSVTVVDGALEVDVPTTAFELLSLAPDDRIFYRVIDPKGETLTGYPGLGVVRANTVRDPDRPVFSDAEFRGVPVRIVQVARLITEAELRGAVQVLVAQTEEARHALAQDMLLTAIAAILGLSILAVLAVILAVRIALRPLIRIETALAQRDPANLAPLQLETPHETGRLVDVIDDLMIRLAGHMDAMRNFIGDVSHQLRTPLAAIRAQAEEAKDEDAEPERMRAALDRIHRQTVQLSRLVNQLLAQAMVAHRDRDLAHEGLDAVELAYDAMEIEAFGMAGDAGFTVRVLAPSVPIRGDQVTLTEALRNLIDNARQHGRPPFLLEISIRPGGFGSGRDAAILCVQDQGDGMDADALEEALRRFGASGIARPGGLGLAIAGAVVRRHGGRLEAERQEAGFRMSMLLPLAEEIRREDAA